jgi:hypothetical protein
VITASYKKLDVPRRFRELNQSMISAEHLASLEASQRVASKNKMINYAKE